MKLTKGNLNQMNNKGKSVKHYKKKKTFRRKKEMHGKTMKRLRNNVYFGGVDLNNFEQTFGKLTSEFKNKYKNLTEKEQKSIRKSFDELIKGPFAEHVDNENRIFRLKNFIQVEVNKTKPSAPPADAQTLDPPTDANTGAVVPLVNAEEVTPSVNGEPVPIPNKRRSIYSSLFNRSNKPQNAVPIADVENSTPTGTVIDVKNPDQQNKNEKTDNSNNNDSKNNGKKPY